MVRKIFFFVAFHLFIVNGVLAQAEVPENVVSKGQSSKFTPDQNQIIETEVRRRALEIMKQLIVSGFVLNGSELPEECKKILDKKVAVLKSYPELHIRCVGYSCDLGTGVVNMYIGLERAKTMKNYLVSKGIPANRIIADTKGSANPLVPNVDEAHRKKNRRVELEVF